MNTYIHMDETFNLTPKQMSQVIAIKLGRMAQIWTPGVPAIDSKVIFEQAMINYGYAR